MITGVRREKLTVETILQKISPYDIFRYYMDDKKWKLNEPTHSPFHKDDNPSFVIGNKYGYMAFIDFADPSKRGDCFDFVKMLYGIPSMDLVLKRIDKDFGLGISSSDNVGEYKKIVSQYKQPAEDATKHYSVIQVTTRKFTQEELDYWAEYGQTIEDLKREKVYSLSKVYLNRQLFSMKPDELRFGYLYDRYWKIYRPFASKKNKWMPNNVPLIETRGLENLDVEHNTLICKSLKDYMVCLKVYPYICHVQNESLAAFSEETVAYIKAHSNEVFYAGDSDEPGKAASYAITQAFGFKHINTPDRLLPEVNDFAGWGRKEGIDEIRKHFIRKGLI